MLLNVVNGLKLHQCKVGSTWESTNYESSNHAKETPIVIIIACMGYEQSTRLMVYFFQDDSLEYEDIMIIVAIPKLKD